MYVEDKDQACWPGPVRLPDARPPYAPHTVFLAGPNLQRPPVLLPGWNITTGVDFSNMAP